MTSLSLVLRRCIGLNPSAPNTFYRLFQFLIYNDRRSDLNLKHHWPNFGLHNLHSLGILFKLVQNSIGTTAKPEFIHKPSDQPFHGSRSTSTLDILRSQQDAKRNHSSVQRSGTAATNPRRNGHIFKTTKGPLRPLLHLRDNYSR